MHGENSVLSGVEIPQETKELIDGSNKGFWRNMNKVEEQKLEWMTNLPRPKPVNLKVIFIYILSSLFKNLFSYTNVIMLALL